MDGFFVPMLFYQYINDFTHYLRFEKRYSTLTLKAYESDLGKFSAYLTIHYPEILLPEINHLHLRSWLSSLKECDQKASSINRKISSLSSYFKFLLRKGVVSKNPVSLLHNMRLPERLPQFLKVSETEFLFEELQFEANLKGITERLILELLYTTGIRRAEIINLKESDIEWSMQQIRVWGKGNKERLLPVADSLLDTLRDYIGLKKSENIQTLNLLVLPNGKPLYDKYVYLTVKKYLSQVSTIKKKSPHVLRHTFATHLLNNGASIQAIKELLGHASIAATQVYTHINIDELKKIHKLSHPRG